jgi:hypothetical protein
LFAFSYPVPQEILVNETKGTPEIEKEHVTKVYDIIAMQWNDTRAELWPRVVSFMASQPPGSLTLTLIQP